MTWWPAPGPTILQTPMALPERRYLAFEFAARELDEKLAAATPGTAEHDEARAALEKLLSEKTTALSPWERVQLARHPDRPYALDLIGMLFTDFEPLAGDRRFGEDPALVAGLARFGGRGVVVMGQQKGRTTEERAYRQFGMPRPEGYRKAQRLVQLAARFSLPVVTFVDTPGAHPGIEAEERGQAQAIAESIYQFLETPVPTISLVLGEGGSGGALALASTDRVLMAEHAIYTVISPEGCASILWRDSTQAPRAAEALRGDANSLKEFGIIDEIVVEPAGGAHREPKAFARSAKKAIEGALADLTALSTDERLGARRRRYRELTRFAVAGEGA